jgi:hypothetical protein
MSAQPLIRIKPKAAPYRRAGVAFTSDREFLVFGPADLSPRQLAVLAQDAELTIELQEDGSEDWTPIPEALRASSAEALANHSDEEWGEIEAAWRAEHPIPEAGGDAEPTKTPRKGRSAAK